MSTQAGFALRGRNPDVLTCIANLSNDEVFTPPSWRTECWTRWPRRGQRTTAERTSGRTRE